jgi:tripartite-type tricarboxylate transporter receptor subunit TctC
LEQQSPRLRQDGGGIWARLIAQRLGSYIAGHPTVVPVNVPGAGSLLLANQVYNTQPQDGTVVGLINRGLPFEKLLGGPGILFDPQKIEWIGSPDLDTGVCAARKDAAVQTLSDLETKELVVGATGSGADTAIYPQVLSGTLGLKFKIVSGYPGSHDVSLAMERGEVQGECVVYDTLSRESYFKQGKINVLLQLASEPDPRLSDVPLASRLANNEQDRQALNLFILRAALGRPFVAGPGVPEDRIAALRDAFAASMKDDTLLQEAQHAGLHPQYISAKRIEDVIAAAYGTPEIAIERLKRAYGR